MSVTPQVHVWYLSEGRLEVLAFAKGKQPAYEIEVCRKEPIMTRTPISIFISSTHVESTFVDRLVAGGRWSSRVWNVLCLLRQEVLHA